MNKKQQLYLLCVVILTVLGAKAITSFGQMRRDMAATMNQIMELMENLEHEMQDHVSLMNDINGQREKEVNLQEKNQSIRLTEQDNNKLVVTLQLPGIMADAQLEAKIVNGVLTLEIPQEKGQSKIMLDAHTVRYISQIHDQAQQTNEEGKGEQQFFSRQEMMRSLPHKINLHDAQGIEIKQDKDTIMLLIPFAATQKKVKTVPVSKVAPV